MPKDTSLRSVLIIGSGPIIIGQACEFDYSGTQASRALREQGIKVSLINSNPATIMTDPMTADKVYLWPLTTESIEKILQEEQIDAVLPTMGGQTALNLCMECDRLGIWQKYNVRIIGVDLAAITNAEDRDIFRQLMATLGIQTPQSRIARSFLEGKEAAQEIGFPLVLRSSFTLGGTGGGFVKRKEDFDAALRHGLESSPVHEVLIEQSIFGWKEYELELLRDSAGNFIVICTIENFDPCGIHTGDSVTVAPALTLPDTAYQEMRNQAIRVMDAIGTFAGGCNIQFALEPETHELVVIEINPRVSRSSALASKATGYPIAKIAALLAIGYTLDELPNQITGTTSACFEPSIDYVVTKIPRWNFDKFAGASRRLGLTMKSVGEVMGIGRSFAESLQKACQSLEIKRNGLGADGREQKNTERLLESLENPNANRLFHIHDALRAGISMDTVLKTTQIDPWFLDQIEQICDTERRLEQQTLETLTPELLRRAKQQGFADRQIAHLTGCLESQVRARRMELGIVRTYKLVDTCAAEFEARTPYYYSTFEGENESIVSDKKKVVILGSGPNRIGQGIEFDYCCVHGLLAAKEAGYEAIMINCNPETVSTDFDMADKLYFEPVFWEHVIDIIEHEKPEGVIVQLGGQTALKLAEKLHKNGIRILGSSFDSIDLAEDRGRFSTLLKEQDIPYPEFGVAHNAQDALNLVKDIGYPVLVRPSYVLGGQRMRIVINDEELEGHVLKVLKELPGNHVLIDRFLEGAIEAEVDALCDGREVQIMGVMEHIEPAGIHSGDSTAVLPPFSLGQVHIELMQAYVRKIALALEVKGLINVQFAIHKDQVYVIEANPRASRSMPFICKAWQVSYLNYATKVMLGTHTLKDFDINPVKHGYAIKVPVFSFNKFPKVNKELGPEMKSTGEEIRFIENLQDPYFLKTWRERNLYLSR
ncbi:MAG: carbamoyl-phosphate synthase large subunit [Bacteroidetes bacterium]|nr:carbamoyl-phosphate synthase large subunit [Bacteroidota bacterium]